MRTVSEQKKQTVGMIGIGIMGSAMSKNLLDAGFSVVGYDILPSAVAAFSEIGGNAAKSVSEVAAQTDILLTSLPSTTALEDIVRELKDTPRADRMLAETSTFPLQDKKAAQQELAEVGIVMLDCPLSGSG